jgi:hypothetical protein
MFHIKKPRDLGAAAIFLLIGLVGLWVARDYDYGAASEMGPGYFPVLVSALLILIGLVVGAQSFAVNGPPIEPIQWRSALLILAGVVVFGLLIEYAGLVGTVIATVLVAGYATHEARLKWSIGLAVLLAAACVAIFIYGLNQAISIWGPIWGAG